MAPLPTCSASRPIRGALARTVLTLSLLAAATLLVVLPATAFAARASSGELLYYPCTNCHPVNMVPGPTPGTEVPSRPLPNGFTGHKIVLQGHDKLGSASVDACLACHDDPARNPGKLITVSGGLVDITGDVSLVCDRCHSAKYKEFKAGTHGKHKPSCVAGGCHDPHTPQMIYAGPLMPFIGTGFQFKAVGVREPFMALATPPLPPEVVTPWWFSAIAVVGLLSAAGLVGGMVKGRLKR